MAGHSKWANIRHRKGAQDKKRAKVFTKIIKEITISARIGGGEISANPRLRKAISNAKSNNLPSDKIERAIKKGTGELEGVLYEEITYGGYGPGGIAIIMDIITDNKNRSVAEIRHILSKYSGKLAEIGSVSWMFEKEGQIILVGTNNNQEVAFESAINFGAKDFHVDNGMYIISTQPDELMEVRDKFESSGYKIQSAEIEMVPKNPQKLDLAESEVIIKLLDMLEDNDDINKIYTDCDFT